MNEFLESIINYKDKKIFKEISSSLNLPFKKHELEKRSQRYANAYNIDRVVYFYPLNDGMPLCGFEFYRKNKLILDNSKEFSQIKNLDEILLNLVRIYDFALDNKIVLDPYYFMLELTDDIHKNYDGRASLVITDKAIRNQKLNKNNFDEANKFYINKFLDHFMGWNFGLSINRCDELKSELEALNEKVIDMGLREYAGLGINVVGTYEESNGLQHYRLKTGQDKKLVYKRSN